MLVLPIKKKWFEMIKSGEKKEEYRECNSYWTTRFINELRKSNDIAINVLFKNGYKKDSPVIKCRCLLTKGIGRKEWGAEPNKEYYILNILEVHKN